MENPLYLIIIFFTSIIGIWIVMFLVPIGPWFTARISGLKISMTELIFMRWRKVPPSLIVNGLMNAVKGDVEVSSDELQALHLAGGDVTKVVAGMIHAKAVGVSLSFKEASQLNLAHKDIIISVQEKSTLD